MIFAVTIFVSLFVILATYWLWCSGSHSKQLSKIKCGEAKEPARWKEPPADERLGDLGELKKAGSLHEYLLQLHNHGHCPVTSFWWGREQVVSICSPQAFKDTIKLTDRAVQLQMVFSPLIGVNCIQYAKGEDWEVRRKSYYPMFKGKTLESYFPHFVHIAEDIEKKWSSLESGERVPLLKTVFSITMKGIIKCMFDESFEDQLLLDKVTAANLSAWKEMATRLKEDKNPPKGSKRDMYFEKNRQCLRGIVKDAISRRQQGIGGEHVPFIDSLLQSGVPDDQAVNDAIAFMIGGFHTTASFIVWLMWHLAMHPEVQDQVRKEVERETGGERGDRLRKYATAVATSFTNYFRQVQDETLRLSTPAAWAVRESPDDIVIDGHLIPGGTPIIQALGVGLHNIISWKEGDMDKFNPDRFATSGDHAKRGLEFCPFGTPSRRKCPGHIFAHFEATAILSILLLQFQVVPIPDQVVEPNYEVVTTPSTELYVFVEKP